jgi:hypothetical protein
MTSRPFSRQELMQPRDVGEDPLIKLPFAAAPPASTISRPISVAKKKSSQQQHSSPNGKVADSSRNDSAGRRSPPTSGHVKKKVRTSPSKKAEEITDADLADAGFVKNHVSTIIQGLFRTKRQYDDVGDDDDLANMEASVADMEREERRRSVLYAELEIILVLVAPGSERRRTRRRRNEKGTERQRKRKQETDDERSDKEQLLLRLFASLLLLSTPCFKHGVVIQGAYSYCYWESERVSSFANLLCSQGELVISFSAIVTAFGPNYRILYP